MFFQTLGLWILACIHFLRTNAEFTMVRHITLYFGCGIRDPQFEVLQIDIMRNDRACHVMYEQENTLIIYGGVPICPLRKRDHCIGVCVGVCIRSASGMNWDTHQVVTLSVKPGEGGFGARPYRDSRMYGSAY